MENKVTTTTKATKKNKNKANVVALVVMAIQIISCFAFCDVAGGGAASAVQSIINIICEVFKYVGMGVLVLGIAKFALALKDENGPGQSQAILYCIAGAVLIGIDVLVSNLGLF